MEQTLSSPSPERLRCWRLFFESALALGDVLDTELEQAVGIPQRWYDVLVFLTDKGADTMAEARRHHRDGIERHFSRHITDADVKALTRALEKVSAHARPLRPGRISG